MSINRDIYKWNKRFPWDRIWRKKYGVSFGSKEHLEITFIQQVFDLKEDYFFDKIGKGEVKKKTLGELFGNSYEFQMTQEEIEKEFDDLDLDSFND